jgi:phosphoglycerate kinase
MAYTLFKAQGVQVGKSRVEEDQVEEMKKLLAGAGGKIVLPCDHAAAFMPLPSGPVGGEAAEPQARR